ncbi:hypothetical protein Tco_0539962 [Tanacetum coccineum]
MISRENTLGVSSSSSHLHSTSAVHLELQELLELLDHSQLPPPPPPPSQQSDQSTSIDALRSSKDSEDLRYSRVAEVLIQYLAFMMSLCVSVGYEHW